MPDAEEALDVVHHRHAEHRRVHVRVRTDRHISQMLDRAVLAVELIEAGPGFNAICWLLLKFFPFPMLEVLKVS